MAPSFNSLRRDALIERILATVYTNTWQVPFFQTLLTLPSTQSSSHLIIVATAQHQLAFGLHTGQTLRQHQQQQDTPPPPQLITEPDPPSSSLSSQHLLDLALSLLDSLTLYSTLSTHPPQTSYLPHLISLSSLSNSNSSILDSLDPDSIPARTLHLTKEYLNRIYAGKPRSQREKGGLGGSDYSVRGVLIGLKNAVERFEKDTKAVVSEIGGQGKHTKGSRDPKEWRERLKIAGGVGTSAHGMLNEEETRQGMKEVERLLEISAEKGSGEAWTLLGDLYLVSLFPFPPFLPSTLLGSFSLDLRLRIELTLSPHFPFSDWSFNSRGEYIKISRILYSRF